MIVGGSAICRSEIATINYSAAFGVYCNHHVAVMNTCSLEIIMLRYLSQHELKCLLSAQVNHTWQYEWSKL